MSSIEPTSPQRHKEALHADHDALRSLVSAVADEDGLESLAGALSALTSALTEHFASEEGENGRLTGVVGDAPRYANAVSHLVAEHRAFERDLVALRQAVVDCLEGPVARIRRDRDALMARLRDHEERENSLAARAVYDEVGDGD